MFDAGLVPGQHNILPHTAVNLPIIYSVHYSCLWTIGGVPAVSVCAKAVDTITIQWNTYVYSITHTNA